MIRLLHYGPAADAPPLLAVPGIDGSIGSIAPIVQCLARRRHVIVADYTAEQNPTLDALAAEIVGAIRTEVAGPLDLLGQSIGTIMAARLAALYSLPVRKVVLIGTFTRARWRALRLSNQMLALTPRWLYRLTAVPLMALVCGPVGDGWRHPFFAAVRRSDPSAAARRTAWQIERDFSADLRRVEQPTLILMGAQDRFVPHIKRELRRLRQLGAGRPVQVVAIPRAGHVLLPSRAVTTAVVAIERFLG